MDEKQLQDLFPQSYGVISNDSILTEFDGKVFDDEIIEV